MKRQVGCLTLPRSALLACGLLLGAMLALAGCGAQAGQWETLHIGFGAHALTLAVDPFSAGRVYVGGDDGVVYTALADQTGQPVPSQGIPTGARVNALFPDLQRAGVILAGTSAGLYRSSNDGQAWAAYGAGLPSGVLTALSGDASGATLLLAISGHGVYLSHDHGARWLADSDGLPSAVRANALLCVSASVCYAATSGSNGVAGVYGVGNGSAKWEPSAQGLPSGAVYALAALRDRSLSLHGATIFAATTHGVFSSVDKAASWQSASVGLPRGSAQALSASSLAPGLLYAGVGAAAYRSTDGGRHWAAVGPGLAGLGAPITAIVAVQGAQSGVVTFAAAGQLARIPAAPGSDNTIPAIIGTLILLALLPLIVYRVYRAVNRRVRPRRPPPGAQAAAEQRQGGGLGVAARNEAISRMDARSGRGASPSSTSAGSRQQTTKAPTTTQAPPASSAKVSQNGHSGAHHSPSDPTYT